jgi:hypothetical protein
MIPSDLASRLRVLIESSVQPLSLLQEIPGDLPKFETGQRFSALIQAPLPDGSFRAIVAGKTLTLALPESARNGDVLELMVTTQRDGIVYARRADGSITTPQTYADNQPKPVLSQTGQLISQLLTGRFGETEPTPLNPPGQALSANPQNAPELAQVLKQAVSSSGLFYESHLQQWIEGKISLETLRREPQARQAPLLNQITDENSAPIPKSPPIISAAQGENSPPTPNVPHHVASVPRNEMQAFAASYRNEFTRSVHMGNTLNDSGPLTDPSAKPLTSHSIAEALMPVVQQQLETLSSNQMSWQGQVWPGMQMQWEILDPNQHPDHTGDNEEPTKFWRSSLRLTLPKLGDVEAQLVLGPQGLTVLIDTDNPASAENMRIAGPRLNDALASSGITLINLQVHDHAQA